MGTEPFHIDKNTLNRSITLPIIGDSKVYIIESVFFPSSPFSLYKTVVQDFTHFCNKHTQGHMALQKYCDVSCEMSARGIFTIDCFDDVFNVYIVPKKLVRLGNGSLAIISPYIHGPRLDQLLEFEQYSDTYKDLYLEEIIDAEKDEILKLTKYPFLELLNIGFAKISLALHSLNNIINLDPVNVKVRFCSHNEIMPPVFVVTDISNRIGLNHIF